MTEFIFTPEQKEAWDFIEKRRTRFMEKIARVCATGVTVKYYVCDCCGYPFLYFSMDERYSCPICSWDPDDDSIVPDSPHIFVDQQERPVVTLADARVNFLRRGCCFTENTICSYGDDLSEWGLRFPKERNAIIAALDALGADVDLANDESHWKAIRSVYNDYARLEMSDSDWNRVGMQSWVLADKIERM